MTDKKTYLILGLLFILALVIKLAFIRGNPGLSYDAYNVMKNVDAIKETGRPLFYDPLSYGGRANRFSPLYFYFLGAFSFFLDTELVLKLVPAIISLSMLAFMYLLVYEITKNKPLSFAFGFLSVLMPSFFAETVFSASIYSVTLPLMILTTYLFLRLNKAKYACFTALALFIILDPAAIILMLGFVFYLGISKLVKSETRKTENELIIFSVFFYSWFYFIIFKKAFQAHGFSIIWHNLPSKIMADYFIRTNTIEILAHLGLFISLLGIFSIYHSIFVIKKKSLLVVTGTIASTIIALLLRLINLETGLLFLSMLFLVHAANTLKIIHGLLKKTKFSKFSNCAAAAVIFIIVISTAGSAALLLKNKQAEIPGETDLAALEWIRENTPLNATIFASIDEGHLINAVAERKNVIDRNFLLIENIDERFNDADKIFTLRFETEAINVFDKYGADYLLFSESVQKKEGIDEPYYASDTECFELKYDDVAKVYQVKCSIKKKNAEKLI